MKWSNWTELLLLAETRQKEWDGITRKKSADLFAMMVFHSDDFVALKKDTCTFPPTLNGFRRLLTMTKNMPMELQMRLANLIFLRNRLFIPIAEAEVAFRSLATALSTNNS